jgi:hypothetical protein
MTITALSEAIDRFAAAVVKLEDDQLDLPWVWRDYDSDGVRFAYFRTLEELRGLAADLERETRTALPPTTAAILLRPYHAAFREMHALLLGIEGDAFETIPAEGEWPLRKVIAHAVDADVGFYAVVSETLQAVRAGEAPPRKLADDIWDGMVGMPISDFDRMLESDVQGLLAFHRAHHARILTEFSTITDEEIESPSYYWEKSSYSLRFRMGRFESHLRQHNIQLAKTRERIGSPPSESQRLLLLLYSALAEVENLQRDFGGDAPKSDVLAESIDSYAGGVQAALG